MFHVVSQTDITEFLPSDGPGRIIGLVLLALLGWGGRGFILAFREDKRKGRADNVDLIEDILKVNKSELDNLRRELEAERIERRKLSNRIYVLERALVAANAPIPPDV